MATAPRPRTAAIPTGGGDALATGLTRLGAGLMHQAKKKRDELKQIEADQDYIEITRTIEASLADMPEGLDAGGKQEHVKRQLQTRIDALQGDDPERAAAYERASLAPVTSLYEAWQKQDVKDAQEAVKRNHAVAQIERTQRLSALAADVADGNLGAANEAKELLLAKSSAYVDIDPGTAEKKFDDDGDAFSDSVLDAQFRKAMREGTTAQFFAMLNDPKFRGVAGTYDGSQVAERRSRYYADFKEPWSHEKAIRDTRKRETADLLAAAYVSGEIGRSDVLAESMKVTGSFEAGNAALKTVDTAQNLMSEIPDDQFRAALGSMGDAVSESELLQRTMTLLPLMSEAQRTEWNRAASLTTKLLAEGGKGRAVGHKAAVTQWKAGVGNALGNRGEYTDALASLADAPLKILGAEARLDPMQQEVFSGGVLTILSITGAELAGTSAGGRIIAAPDTPPDEIGQEQQAQFQARVRSAGQTIFTSLRDKPSLRRMVDVVDQLSGNQFGESGMWAFKDEHTVDWEQVQGNLDDSRLPEEQKSEIWLQMKAEENAVRGFLQLPPGQTREEAVHAAEVEEKAERMEVEAIARREAEGLPAGGATAPSPQQRILGAARGARAIEAGASWRRMGRGGLTGRTP